MFPKNCFLPSTWAMCVCVCGGVWHGAGSGWSVQTFRRIDCAWIKHPDDFSQLNFQPDWLKAKTQVRKATRTGQEWAIEGSRDSSKCYIFLSRKTWFLGFAKCLKIHYSKAPEMKERAALRLFYPRRFGKAAARIRLAALLYSSALLNVNEEPSNLCQN